MKKFVSKINEALQTLGRSMLLPVAAMPFAGLVLRLASDDMLNIPLLKAAGDAVFGNLDMLFAVGVAIGFAKAKDKGIPALVGVLSLLVFKQGLGIMDENINMGIFAGIISGIVGGLTYNKFKNQKLPVVFSFFAGEKFPIIMVMIFQTVLAFVFSLIWPSIQWGLDSFAQSLLGMGALGVGLFTFLNRLLIPFGLHHVLNNYIYFELGSFVNSAGEVVKGEIPRFLAGDPSSGLFLAGFFITMMFGIPGIAAAIIKTAKKEKRKEAEGMMVSGALTSFVAGITEPIEFTFMFLSPKLYFIHALYTGLAGMVVYALNIHIGFAFGSNIIDYLLNFRIATNPLLIFPVGIVFFFLYFFTFSFFIKRDNIKTIGREDDIDVSELKLDDEENFVLESNNYAYLAKKMVESLGGKDNIAEAFSCNTRLRVEVIDPTIVNEQKIKLLGVRGIVRPSEKAIQIIIGLEVTYIMAEVDKILG